MQIPLSFQKILARKMPKLFFPLIGAIGIIVLNIYKGSGNTEPCEIKILQGFVL
jgi:hypothetical protein